MDPRITKENGGYVYEPCNGTVADAAALASKEAAALGEPVTLKFNGTAIRVAGGRDPADVVEEYHKEFQRAAAARAASPEGRAAEARRQAELARKQGVIDDLVCNKLGPALEKGIGSAVGWVKDFAAVADNRFLNRRYPDILPKLKAAGYKADAHVDKKDFGKDYAVMGEYIIGQAIAAMDGGMPPHPALTAKFVADMGKIGAVTTFPVMHQIRLNGNPPPPTTITLSPKIQLKGPKTGT